MWLFTKYGFFSVVKADNDQDTMMIRARVQKHLVRLIESFSYCILATVEDIIKTDDSDYRYRLLIDRHHWENLVVGLASEIDYSNFKEAVGKKDKPYHDALLTVWRTMERLQPRSK